MNKSNNGYEYVQKQLEDCFFAVKRLHDKDKKQSKNQNIDFYLEKTIDEINQNFDHDLVLIQQLKSNVVKEYLIEYLNQIHDKQIKDINKVDKYLGFLKSDKKIKPINSRKRSIDEDNVFYTNSNKSKKLRKKESFTSNIDDMNRSRNDSDDSINNLQFKIKKYINLLKIKKKKKKKKKYTDDNDIFYEVSKKHTFNKRCSHDSTLTEDTNNNENINTYDKIENNLQIMNSIYDLYNNFKDSLNSN